ncbi:MAG: amino acid permease [Betaproteobacteria bacterium]|nr:amino acid permease [Betaproteobacteria bacterium]
MSPATAVAIIVGIVIGAGIFKTPSMVASVSGDAGWMMLAWVAGAVISIAGALCYAELSSRYAHAGGDYHFLEIAYGKHLSFLYAWAKAMVINTGSIALLAFVFADYMSQAVPLGAHSSAIWAIGIVLLLTVVNLIGLQASGRVQSALTIIEVFGLLAVVVAGFSVQSPASETPSWFSGSPPLGLAGLALVFVLLTFGGWNESAFIAAEVKGGPRSMVPVILISLGLITLIYLFVNLALLHGLGLSGLAKSKAAAADVMGMAFGTFGQQALSLFVAMAALTSINATMIVGARSNFAVASSWRALRPIASWNQQAGTPVAALLLQSLYYNCENDLPISICKANCENALLI